jgi:hypothetical protein
MAVAEHTAPLASKAIPSYKGYIASAKWRLLRASAIERDGGRCRLCNSGKRLTVHHRIYPARWELDNLDNLTTLCSACHRHIEHRSRSERYASKPIKVEVRAFEVRGRSVSSPVAVAVLPGRYSRVK